MQQSFLLILILVLVITACNNTEPSPTDQQNPEVASDTARLHTNIPPGTDSTHVVPGMEEANIGNAGPTPQKVADSEIPEDIQVSTYQTKKGWGFEIHFGNTRYMHQPIMPAVGIHKGFENQMQARKVGELAVAKIKAGIMPPPFTETEVDSIIQLYK